jgi:hypothetical protein
MSKRNGGLSWFAAFVMLVITLALLFVVFITGSLPPQVADILSPRQTVQITTTLPPVTQPVELSRAGSFRFHYSQLNAAQREVYNTIFAQLPYFPESIEVSGIDAEGMKEVFSALVLDQPMLFHISSTHYRIRSLPNGNVVAFVPEYRLSREEYAQRVNAVTARAQSIPLPYGGSDFDIQLALHDFVLRHCSYADDLEDSEIATVYGALIEGRASCVGYAKAMLLLLELNGIDAYIVTGYATNASFSGPHAWNKVRIGGNWYYMDATWNDPVMEGGREIISRAFFNLTAAELAHTHELESSRAHSRTHNYFRMRGLYFDQLDRQSEARLAQAMAEAIASERNVLEIRMSSAEGLAQAMDYLFGRQLRVHRILAAADPDGRLQQNRVYHSVMEDLNMIRIFPMMR